MADTGERFTDEDVQRAAEAMFDAMPGIGTWISVSSEGREFYLGATRAVLSSIEAVPKAEYDALRESRDGWIAACREAEASAEARCESYRTALEDLRARAQAVVDAARSPSEGGNPGWHSGDRTIRALRAALEDADPKEQTR